MTTFSIFRLMKELSACIGQDLPMTIALVFSRIAAAGTEGVLQATVQRELALSGAAMSRSVQTLSVLHWEKTLPGLDLIARSFDSRDCRQRVLRLTAKGEALVAKVTEAAPRCSA
jgi:DNA-binding MarR family transcriptional regulator